MSSSATPVSSHLAQMLLQLKQIPTEVMPDESKPLKSASFPSTSSTIDPRRRSHDMELEDPQSSVGIVKVSSAASEEDSEDDMANLSHPPSNGEFVNCNCRKSRCLKLYCQCFASRIVCNPTCNCISCANTSSDICMRTDAVKMLLERNPNAFDSKFRSVETVVGVIHKTGCRCRKSKCLKKYCECFQASVPCSATCTCLHCCNVGPGGASENIRIRSQDEDSMKAAAQELALMRAAVQSRDELAAHIRYSCPKPYPYPMKKVVESEPTYDIEKSYLVNGGGGISRKRSLMGDTSEIDRIIETKLKQRERFRSDHNSISNNNNDPNHLFSDRNYNSNSNGNNNNNNHNSHSSSNNHHMQFHAPMSAKRVAMGAAFPRDDSVPRRHSSSEDDDNDDEVASGSRTVSPDSLRASAMTLLGLGFGTREGSVGTAVAAGTAGSYSLTASQSSMSTAPCANHSHSHSQSQEDEEISSTGSQRSSLSSDQGLGMRRTSVDATSEEDHTESPFCANRQQSYTEIYRRCDFDLKSAQVVGSGQKKRLWAMTSEVEAMISDDDSKGRSLQ